MQKGCNFWQFKDHKSGRRYGDNTNDPIFFICFSSPNCLRTISKKFQKGYNFWQFKEHKSGRRYENNTNDPIVFICFSSPNCLWTSFFAFKNCQNSWGYPLFHSGLQNTWILELKAVRLMFSPVQFRKHTHWGKWKTWFYFFCQVENKFQNVQGNLMI